MPSAVAMSNVTPECAPDTVTVNVASTVPLLPSVTLTSSMAIVAPGVPTKRLAGVHRSRRDWQQVRSR